MSIPLLQHQMRDGQRLVMTTAYDAATACLADPVVDMILVGDSVAMCAWASTTRCRSAWR
jgi:3-methyl-2-oxobutanoate hydroxymethyltransferase